MPKLISLVVMSSLSLVACSPPVGSEAWCQAMKAKMAGDWSTNEAADFAKHCIFK